MQTLVSEMEDLILHFGNKTLEHFFLPLKGKDAIETHAWVRIGEAHT